MIQVRAARLAPFAVLALLALAPACSGAEPDTGEAADALHAASSDYGYEFETDALGPNAAPAAPVPVAAPGPGGRLSPEAIRDVVRAAAPPMAGCYKAALGASPGLAGEIAARFVIHEDGSVTGAQLARSTLPEGAFTACVVAAFGALGFPTSSHGRATVVYPIRFAP
jgi:hypothetical protein